MQLGDEAMAGLPDDLRRQATRQMQEVMLQMHRQVRERKEEEERQREAARVAAEEKKQEEEALAAARALERQRLEDEKERQRVKDEKERQRVEDEKAAAAAKELKKQAEALHLQLINRRLEEEEAGRAAAADAQRLADEAERAAAVTDTTTGTDAYAEERLALRMKRGHEVSSTSHMPAHRTTSEGEGDRTAHFSDDDEETVPHSGTRQQRPAEPREESPARSPTQKPAPPAEVPAPNTPTMGAATVLQGLTPPHGARRPHTIMVGMNGLIVQSPRGEFLLQLEVAEPEGQPADTTVLVPQGVETVVRGVGGEQQLRRTSGSRLQVITDCRMVPVEEGAVATPTANITAATNETDTPAEEPRPSTSKGETSQADGDHHVTADSEGTGGQPPPGAHAMPWQQNYEGVGALRQLAAALCYPGEVAEEMVVVPGGRVTTSLVARRDGQLELITSMSTRYAPMTAGRCTCCGQDTTAPERNADQDATGDGTH